MAHGGADPVNASAFDEHPALKHASARFCPAATRSASVRRVRMVCCRRSRGAATTTFGYDRVGCSVFLNNRYMDPTVSVFLSVDPLVAKTGDPYLYAGGNPTTLSDPSGLCSVYSPTSGIIDDGYGKCASDNSGHGGSHGSASGGCAYGLNSVCGSATTVADPAATQSVSQKTVDAISEAGESMTGEGKMAVGGCGEFDAGFIAAFSGQGCFIVTAKNFGTVESVAAGLGTPNAAISGGLILSNAQSLKDLSGLNACVSGSAGGGVVGGVTVCGGLTPDLEFNGIVTTFPNVGIGIEPGGSAMVTVGRTFVQEWGGTPSVVRWFLPGLSNGRQIVVNWDADPTEQHYVGRHDAGIPGGLYDAGTPG